MALLIDRVDGTVFASGQRPIAKASGPAAGAAAVLEASRPGFQPDLFLRNPVPFELDAQDREVLAALVHTDHAPGLRDSLGTAGMVSQNDAIAFRELQRLGPKRLRGDMFVRAHYKRLTQSVQHRMTRQIRDVLGVAPEGAPKNVDRAVDKLLVERKVQPDTRLGQLDDLTRGRINLDRYEPAQMREMLAQLQAYFGDGNIQVNDYMRGRKFYRGRIHVKLLDRSGMWFELQIGPRQLSAFFDTPFPLGAGQANIHDAVYKGVMRLDTEGLKALGQGDLNLGRYRQERVLNSYRANLDDVMTMAKMGIPYDFGVEAADLVKQLKLITRDVPEHLRPIGLQGV